MTSGKSRRSLRISVGTKLAAGTIVLVVAVTFGVHESLSRTQRENLLSAKEMSVGAVTQLFVDSCAAGVVFGDQQTVEDELATLGRNEDVEYAAVWAVDPSGKVGNALGEFMRRAPRLTLERAPPVPQLVREADRVRISSAIVDQHSAVVGATAVAFSLARENRAIAAIKRTTLLASTAVALALVLLLMGMARLIIVGPLGKLVSAARQIENGEKGEVDVHTSDEVGQLAGAFREMAVAIREREERIAARNRDIRLVLDNVGQGFITLEADGTLSTERSRVVDEWFGPVSTPMKFWDYLAGRVDGETGKWFELGWTGIQDDRLPLELLLEQLPKGAQKEGRFFEFVYRPILREEKLSKLIVVITDITARIEREMLERSQREMMSIFRRILSDRISLDDFFGEVSELVTAIAASPDSDRDLLKRQIHTVKGNTALFGIESVADLCHRLEDRLDDVNSESAGLTAAEKEELRQAWAKIVAMREQLAVGSSSGGVQLDKEEYTSFLASLADPAVKETIRRTAESWRFEAVDKRLSLVGEQISALARRLNKAPVSVTCIPSPMRLPQEKWRGFWSAFAHVVRNTVDHGVDTSDERVSAGKPERAVVTLGIQRESDAVVVSIRDDGKGINWKSVGERARERGLPCTTTEDLKDALFAEGVSTRTTVTSTSGRGVGLSVIKEFVKGVGGTIELSSELGRGTEFRFRLPLAMLTSHV